VYKTATFFRILCIALLLFTAGCVQHRGGGTQDDALTIPARASYRGEVIELSKRPRTLTVEIVERGAPQAISFYYNDKTRGIDNAVPGRQVIVSGKNFKGRLYAQSVRPDVAGFAAGVREISVKKVKSMLGREEEMLLVDARSATSYQQGHLPGAVNIPACEIKNSSLLPEEKEMLLVFYCGGPLCGISTNASSAAARAGYTNVSVMRSGISGWLDAGYVTVADDAAVLNRNTVLIDLRPASRDTVERIPGSVSIPFDTLGRRLRDIPRKAPVIVYSDNIQQSRAALTSLHKAGLRRVSMVNGNIQGWKQRNGKVTSGAVVTDINWKKIPARNEISAETFSRALGGSGGVSILDVRTAAETAAGTLPGAKNIPLNDLFKRIVEIPRSTAVYVYSSSGARAEMAARLLRGKGYRASFLDAYVDCSGGRCSILR
jgi:rhodanese-related sulfurtransferase